MTKEILPLQKSLGYQIRTSHRLIQRRLQSLIEPHGVSLGMWYFLRVLWHKEGLTQSELSQLVGTMEPTTLTALRSMERCGFIKRERNALDGRKINIYLTDLGRELEGKLVPLAKEVLSEASSGLSDSEMQTLLRLLNVIQTNLADHSLLEEI
ncbi:MarR family winged helix-turn-helix transcriptional regulator [Paenalcaligenes hominis]|uniref:MarR family winged helix-turn-helix transcriptional regulator n=1 Tax=Paenalcaligenes hominis TaxID=643674 RepID=UPI0035251132